MKEALQKEYIIFWQRLANSGVNIISADNKAEAISKATQMYNPEFCKCIVIEITNSFTEFGKIGWYLNTII